MRPFTTRPWPCIYSKEFKEIYYTDIYLYISILWVSVFYSLNKVGGKCGLDYLFYAPVTIVGGIKICPCLSVCLSVCPSVRPSVRHALRYRVCVINSSHSFHWIFLKPCIFVVDILKMCMWVFGGARINFDRITAFQT